MRAPMLLVTALSLVACRTGRTAAEEADSSRGPTFGDDVAFLERHTDLVVLAAGSARVAVAPGYQGRVMTSTTAGDSGASLGYVHREGVASKQRQAHMHVVGGEDRFWVGPEGGQFGLYFAAGAPFDLEHWQVPEPIDWGGWDVVSQDAASVRFRKEMSPVNWSGTRFDLRVDRTVRLVGAEEIGGQMGAPLPASVRAVGFESQNTITNTGAEPWRRATGLVSIWILGMFVPSPQTTVVIPFKEGPESMGPAVNDDYFGEVPADRLVVDRRMLFFRGDGEHRGKIGVPAARALAFLGSWAADRGVLTLVTFTPPPFRTDEYVNSRWERQEEPFGGDVVNSYNDGPPAAGQKPLGPFYELETSSPAAALEPQKALTHTHRTIHLEGPEPELDAIARRTLGVGLHAVREAFEAGSRRSP